MQNLNFCKLLIWDSQLKITWKSLKNHQTLCANLINIERKLGKQGFFNLNVFMIVTFFQELVFFFIYLDILINFKYFCTY